MNTNSSTATPFEKPLYVMLKPIGYACNLKCDYCYYLEKKELYPNVNNFVMKDAVLEEFIKQYIDSQYAQNILFTWHGGETLLRDISFYKKALELQQKYANGKIIENTLQTNGTLLNDEWCAFFKENNFLIGISVDGPEKFHDKYRMTNNNQPTFKKVIDGISLLKKHGVEYNILGVVNDYNVDYPLEFYNFFKEIDTQFIQFTPIVEKINGKMAPWNVPSEKWGDFLIAIFNEWIKKDVGRVFVQYFDATLANWVGVNPGICTLAKTCGHAGVMEFNGDVYSCDHFVFPEYKLGNIKDNTLREMMDSPQQKKFGNDKYDTLPSQCKNCKFLFACHGECPKNRIIKTPSGEEGLNYLCEGYYKFYNHVAPFMDFMKNELKYHRAPANIMNSNLVKNLL